MPCSKLKTKYNIGIYIYIILLAKTLPGYQTAMRFYFFILSMKIKGPRLRWGFDSVYLFYSNFCMLMILYCSNSVVLYAYITT